MPLTEESAEKMGAQIIVPILKSPEYFFAAKTDVRLFELHLDFLGIGVKCTESQKCISGGAA